MMEGDEQRTHFCGFISAHNIVGDPSNNPRTFSLIIICTRRDNPEKSVQDRTPSTKEFNLSRKREKFSSLHWKHFKDGVVFSIL